MSVGERKLVLILLVMIMIFSCILIFQIKNEPKYDPILYSQIYEEYDSIFSTDEVTTENIIESEKNQINTIASTKVKNNTNSNNVIGEIIVPAIRINYPILKETTDAYLKIAPTKLAGPDVNEVGNLCIVGHNYKNDQFFSKLSKLENNDKIFIKSIKGGSKTYIVYNKYEVNEDDMSCLNQETDNKKEVTLITCTKQKQKRLIVKCVEA